MRPEGPARGPALQGGLVADADRYRDPDEDLPRDFDERREDYYAGLGQPLEADRFVDSVKAEMEEALGGLDAGMPKNAGVRISERSGGRISVSPLKPRPDPPNLDALKAEIGRRWPTTGLLDVLKEADLRVGFTDLFETAASREALERGTLRRRLLLCLYGLGTNVGLKRMAGSDTQATERELRWVSLKFVSREHLRAAIAEVANATFAVRRPEVWGEATTACASDSKKFGAWDQNLMTEWHIRYGGRGVMIYWHVERRSVCVYSQLKSASSSEVAAMIEGVLRHCTDMTIEKNFVDSHGQSEIAFCFARLLGFELMPRLKAIAKQKLYLPGKGSAGRYPNLRPVLTRSIDWGLIRREYDRMVRYAAALKSGTADAESILRRFSRGAPGDKGSPMHPTYRALAELGKAVKTVFLCRYLGAEGLRREVHEGLNTVERWNAANSFVFFGKGGEVATNRLEDQETSVLALHLLQGCLVYVNTLMIQSVLADPSWSSRMTPRDLSALTPLIFHHVNSYGAFGSFYETVWKARRTQDVVLVKTLLYTGVRVTELVNIRLKDVDFDRCQVRINEGKGKKDRVVPFPAAFKETPALHAAETERRGASYLFESSWKKKYTDRGVRKILARYAEKAGLERPISPHKMRHFLFTWLKKQGVDDALIQPYSGHESRKSLEVYSLLAIGEAQGRYDEVMGRFPV